MSDTAAALVIRADASATMGTGHVMRCLGLGAAWPGDVHFVCAGTLPAGLQERVRELGFESHTISAAQGSIADAEQTVAVARNAKASWTVADGYQFDAGFEQQLSREGQRVLVIDDFVHARHVARLVLNQNLHATRAPYEPVVASQELLLGPEYALLRREFWGFRGSPAKAVAPIRRVLVTLGGSDPARVAPRVVRALSGSGFDVRLLLGGADPHGEETTRLAKASGFDVVRDARDVPEHMAWADLAIASAGVTLLELLFMGCPTLAVVVADNQQPNAAAAESRDLVRVLGWHEDVTETMISEAVRAAASDPSGTRARAERGRAVVDGHGPERVCRKMLAIQ